MKLWCKCFLSTYKEKRWDLKRLVGSGEDTICQDKIRCCCQGGWYMRTKDLALDATTTIGVYLGQGLRKVDIKKYIKVDKVPGGQLEDSKVLKGVMFNKYVVAPGKI